MGFSLACKTRRSPIAIATSIDKRVCHLSLGTITGNCAVIEAQPSLECDAKGLRLTPRRQVR
jgi:hypothetical protein